MRWRNLWAFIKGIILMQLFLLVLIAGVTWDIGLDSFEKPDLTAMLLPISYVRINEQSATRLMSWSSSSLAMSVQSDRSFLEYFSRRMPEDMMVSNLRVLASRGVLSRLPGPNFAIQDAAPVSRTEENDIDNRYSEKLKGHSVVVYCTHSAESYIPDSGKARLDGESGLVGMVARALADDIGRYGARTEYIDTLHDCPDYNLSYTRSRETVKTVMESHEDLLALFDIHRDSIPGQEDGETITINHRPSARILIIVGSNERKPHPHWRENQAFAEKLCKVGEEIYPGLIKGLKVKAGTYNQEYFPHSLLLEFGSDRNTLAEATYAAELFAEVLVRTLDEETKS